jgi:sigma-E factor negative regulatory protein RseA
MTEQTQRELSALMDGEFDPQGAEALCDLADADPELRAAWERWHLIGQALRGEPVDAAVRGIADAVRERIESEPVQLVLPRRRRGARLAPFTGAALAAGAAFLAVLSVPVLFHDADGTHPDSGAGSFAESAPSGAAEARRWHLNRPQLASKLDLYLVNHQEAAPATGVRGMLPYATLVGYEAPR